MHEPSSIGLRCSALSSAKLEAVDIAPLRKHKFFLWQHSPMAANVTHRPAASCLNPNTCNTYFTQRCSCARRNLSITGINYECKVFTKNATSQSCTRPSSNPIWSTKVRKEIPRIILPRCHHCVYNKPILSAVQHRRRTAMCPQWFDKVEVSGGPNLRPILSIWSPIVHWLDGKWEKNHLLSPMLVENRKLLGSSGRRCFSCLCFLR